MKPSHHIFISYSREDRHLMERVRELFSAEGFGVWTDEGIVAGTSSWQLAIERAIEEMECLVCILTPAAKRSTWVREELVYASFQKKPIYMLHAQGDYREVAILGFTVTQLVDFRVESQFQIRIGQVCQRISASGRERSGSDQTLVLDQAKDSGPPRDRSGDPPRSQAEEVVGQFIPPAVPATERHALVAVTGSDRLARSACRLDAIVATIGRDAGCTLRISENSVSREHCQLIYTTEGFVLRDLDSTNGTFVNDVRTRIRRLHNQDLIRIGLHCTLRYVVVPVSLPPTGHDLGGPPA